MCSYKNSVDMENLATYNRTATINGERVTFSYTEVALTECKKNEWYKKGSKRIGDRVWKGYFFVNDIKIDLVAYYKQTISNMSASTSTKYLYNDMYFTTLRSLAIYVLQNK